MTNQGTIIDKNTSLILKLTPTVNKHIFSDVDINSTVCIKWWKNSKCFINF